jgi:hypothetical protein
MTPQKKESNMLHHATQIVVKYTVYFLGELHGITLCTCLHLSGIDRKVFPPDWTFPCRDWRFSDAFSSAAVSQKKRAENVRIWVKGLIF